MHLLVPIFVYEINKISYKTTKSTSVLINDATKADKNIRYYLIHLNLSARWRQVKDVEHVETTPPPPPRTT
jgi:hypothetical protein